MTEGLEKLYELKVTPTQVLLRVATPSEGKKANLSDIQKELKTRDVAYRHDHLFEIYRRASNEFEVLAQHESHHWEIVVEARKDGMEAHMVIVPPQIGDEKLDPAMLKRAITSAHISKGILYDEIQRAIREKIENRPIVIAKGKAAVQGLDGEIEFVFDHDAPPPEPGREKVDFKELGLIKNVETGAIIAKITQPKSGEDGYTVLGRELKAKQGKPARVKLGRNVAMSEDGTELRATASGYVLISGDRVAVENVYQVEQVNAATGNVHFTGVVLVKGSVEDNFTVEGEKGIEVGGSVGKAVLRSGGDVKVRGGVMGATIETPHGVSAKFLSESNVQAGDQIAVEDYILHSTVQAGKSVRVTKVPTGFINGGLTRAGDSVVTPNLGSNVAEEKTQVEAGMRPNLRAQFDALGKKMEKDELAFDKLRKNLLVMQVQRNKEGSFDEQKSEVFGKLLESTHQLKHQLMEGVTHYRRLTAELAEPDVERGFVLVENTVYPGVNIQIRRQSMKIKTPLVGSGFRLAKGEIKVHDVAEVARYVRMLAKGEEE